MNEHDPWERDIDRFIDGELSSDDERRILLECDASPEHWRDLALAFVQSKVLRTTVQDMTAPPPISVAATENSPHSRPWQLITLAASLVLAISVGFAMGRRTTSLGSPDTTSAHSDRYAPDSDLLMLVDNADRQIIQVPLLPMSDADSQQILRQDSISAEAVKQIEQRGHRVLHQRPYYPVQLRDGRNVVVPVDNVRIHYTGYQ